MNDNPNNKIINPVTIVDENTRDENGLRDPSVREYLLLLTMKDDDPDSAERTWEVIKGRENLYVYIRQNLDSFYITKSYVLVEQSTLEEMITVREFMKHCENIDILRDDNFDIDDYLDEEDDIDDEDDDEYGDYYEFDLGVDRSKFQREVKQNNKEQIEMLLGGNEDN